MELKNIKNRVQHVQRGAILSEKRIMGKQIKNREKRPKQLKRK